ncbi:MAG: DUF3592 domain-containing protein [Pseudomonadota bacterium]
MKCPPPVVLNMPSGLFLTLVAFVIVCVSTGHTLLVRIPFEDALDARGVETQAEITGFSEPFKTRRRARGERSQKVFFQYTDRRGEVFEAEIVKNRRKVRRMALGDQFTVRYLPEAPWRHRPSIQTINEGREAVKLGAIGALLLIPLGAFFILRAPSHWSGPRLWPPFSDELV